MPLLKGGSVITDPWRDVADGEPLLPSGAIILAFARLVAVGAAAFAPERSVGVRCANTDSVAALEPYMDRIGLIVLAFPRFGDGRAYSQARALRQTLGFRGELRASGEVLEDQLNHMRRCGFDSFESEADLTAAWGRAADRYRAWYQPAADGMRPIAALRRGGGTALSAA